MAQKDPLHSADLYRFGKSNTSVGNLLFCYKE